VELADDQDAVEELAADAADEASAMAWATMRLGPLRWVAGRSDRGILRHAVSWFAGR
jgi:hypothetical protein